MVSVVEPVLHMKVLPLLAVSVAICPPQMVALLTVGLTMDVAVMFILAEQPTPVVHVKVYTPGALNPVTVVVADDGVVMVTVAGLPAFAVHVPVPDAAIVAVAPSHMV
jgi:hypothetical protein